VEGVQHLLLVAEVLLQQLQQLPHLKRVSEQFLFNLESVQSYEINYDAVFISLPWSLRSFCASKFPVRSLKNENYVGFLYVWEF
jgi:hypothetical protein